MLLITPRTIAVVLLLHVAGSVSADSFISRMLSQAQALPAKLRSLIDDVDISPLQDAAVTATTITSKSSKATTAFYEAMHDESDIIDRMGNELPPFGHDDAVVVVDDGGHDERRRRRRPVPDTTPADYYVDLAEASAQSVGQASGGDGASSSGGDTSGWNPFTWFAPILRTIPYNPDTDLQTCEIATRHGYQCEGHTVITDDGYLLTMHRLPCARDDGCVTHGRRGAGQPVFLQHGLLSSSADWLLSGPGKALAFILADAGYDVWLGNARGNTYSKRHVRLPHDESEFWDFSWHEMAEYDIPAEIDYVYKIRGLENPGAYNRSGEQEPLHDLLYVGHSMGTTMAFAMLSLRPEYNAKIRAGFALAPVAFMGKVKSPIRLLAPFSKDIQIFSVKDRINFANEFLSNMRVPNWVDYIADTLFNRMSLSLLMIVKFLGANEFLPQNKVLQFLAKYGCELTDAERYICENTVFVLCGFDKAQYNETLMPVIFGHTPAGTSTKTVVHYAQEIHEHGNFQYFDYGTKTNRIKYGQDAPPQYDLRNVSAPFALFYAQNDWLAGPEDVGRLFDRLHRTAIGMFKVPFDQFNHVDFLWGKDAPALVYAKMLEVMDRFR